jgi:integrase
MRERAALAGGVDPRAGRERVRSLLLRWLDVRRTTVARKTYRTDQDLARLMPSSLLALQVSSVSGREVASSFDSLLALGLAEASVVRYRASLSAFFGWCLREKMILTNPVTGVRVPKQSAESTEMSPFTEGELEEVYDEWATQSEHLANVLLVLAWTGLRWAEARAITVGDVMEVPTPGLMVRRSTPEGVDTKNTKGRRSRRVPLANRVLPVVRDFAQGKERGRAAAHIGPRCAASPLFHTAVGAVGHDRSRQTTARLAAHRSVPVASSRRRPRNRPGVDGARVHRDRRTDTFIFLGTGADLAGLGG